MIAVQGTLMPLPLWHALMGAPAAPICPLSAWSTAQQMVWPT